jgi:hypothetical protein
MMSALAGVAAVIGVALGGVANDRYGARRVQAVTLPLIAFAFAALSIVALVFSRFHKCETPTLALRADLPKLLVCGESGRIVGKDKVAIGERVTPKAGLMQSLVVRFAVGELREPPTAGRSILL